MENEIINDINLVIKNGNILINKALVFAQNNNNDIFERYDESTEQLEKLQKEVAKIPSYLNFFYDDLKITIDEKKSFLINLEHNFSDQIFSPYLLLKNVIRSFPKEFFLEKEKKLNIHEEKLRAISSKIRNTSFKLIYKIVIEEFKTFFNHLVVNKIFPGNIETKKVWKHGQNVSLIQLGLSEINFNSLLEKINYNHQYFLEKTLHSVKLEELVKKIKTYYTIENINLNEGHVVVKAEVRLQHVEKNDIEELNHSEKDTFEFIIKGYLTEKEHHEKYLLELIDKFDNYYQTTKFNQHLLFYDYEKIVTPEEVGIDFLINLPDDVLTELKILHINAMDGKLVLILKLTIDGKLVEQTKIIEISGFKKVWEIWTEILEFLEVFNNYQNWFNLNQQVAYNSTWLDVIKQINQYLIHSGFDEEIVNKITWKVKRKGLDERLNSCNDFVENEIKKELTGFLLDEKTTFNFKFKFNNIAVKKWDDISLDLNFKKNIDDFYVGPTDSEGTKEVVKTLIENFSEKFRSWQDFIKIYKFVRISKLPGYLKWQGSNITYKEDDKYQDFELTEGSIGKKQNLKKESHDLYTYKHCFSFDFTLYIDDQDTLKAIFIYWGKNENQVWGVSAYFEKGLIQFLTKKV